MDNLWTKLNQKIPTYFNELANKYSLKFEEVSPLKTALIGKSFVILISIDRFLVNVDYIMRDENGKIVIYGCGNFFAEKYDKNDRTNLLQGDNAETIIINNLIVINNGLQSKWDMVLQGNTDWVNDFKISKWFNEKKINLIEKSIIEDFI